MQDRKLSIVSWYGVFALLLAAWGMRGGAQEPFRAVETEAELCRWRIENTRFGRIEISTNGGERWLLIGRVTQPATSTTPEKSAADGGTVVRVGSDGLVFGVGPRRALRLSFAPAPRPVSSRKGKAKAGLPAFAAAPRPFEIVTNLAGLQDEFRHLLPPAHSPVGLETGIRALRPFADSYAPGEQDVFVLSAPIPVDASGERLAKRLENVRQSLQLLARRYADSAIERARTEKRPIVSGTMTLNAELPPNANEPEKVAAVSYVVDNIVIAAKNYAPFSFSWDTRRVTNGEHVVEIRGLSENGNLISRVRALVVVQNTGS